MWRARLVVAHNLCPTSAYRSAYSWLDISASLSDFSAWMVDEASVVAALSRLSAIYSHLGCALPDQTLPMRPTHSTSVLLLQML